MLWISIFYMILWFSDGLFWWQFRTLVCSRHTNYYLLTKKHVSSNLKKSSSWMNGDLKTDILAKLSSKHLRKDINHLTVIIIIKLKHSNAILTFLWQLPYRYLFKLTNTSTEETSFSSNSDRKLEQMFSLYDIGLKLSIREA